MLNVSETELPYCHRSQAAADRPVVQLQPGSLSQLLTVISDLSHITN